MVCHVPPAAPRSLPSHEGSGLKFFHILMPHFLKRLPSHEGSGLKYRHEFSHYHEMSLPSHEGSGLKLHAIGIRLAAQIVSPRMRGVD